ncbi:hypothetical protein IKG64_03040 [Candidatus Saccharibacteria bacterium]|nr:hypothetical protein [Candidatus Saccharibacteria bacterium]
MSIKKLLKKLPLENKYRGYSNKISLDELMNAESELGRTLFGPIPEGHQREFFAGKRNVWFWYESWTDAAGALQEMTVRYEVRPTGVYKRPTGGSYRKIEGDELKNFCKAVRGYLDLVKTKLYC